MYFRMGYRFVYMEVFCTRCNVKAMLFDKAMKISGKVETEMCVLLICWLSKTTAVLVPVMGDNINL